MSTSLMCMITCFLPLVPYDFIIFIYIYIHFFKVVIIYICVVRIFHFHGHQSTGEPTGVLFRHCSLVRPTMRCYVGDPMP